MPYLEFKRYSKFVRNIEKLFQRMMLLEEHKTSNPRFSRSLRKLMDAMGIEPPEKMK